MSINCSKCLGLAGSSTGCVVKRSRSRTYSLGGFFTQGVSRLAVRHVSSMRQIKDSAHVNPNSEKQNLRPGKRSSTPLKTKLPTLASPIWEKLIRRSEYVSGQPPADTAAP